MDNWSEVGDDGMIHVKSCGFVLLRKNENDHVEVLVLKKNKRKK